MLDLVVVADDEVTEVREPRSGAFAEPAPTVPEETAPVLVVALPIRAMRDNQLMPRHFGRAHNAWLS